MANFTVRRIEEHPRLEGDIRIEPAEGSTPSAAAKAYIDTLHDVIAAIASVELESRDDDSADGTEVSAITLDRQDRRRAVMEQLARIAHEFCRLRDPRDEDAWQARDKTLRAHGGFVRDVERIAEVLFSVSYIYDQPADAPNASVVDLAILVVNIGGSPLLKQPTPEQRQLYTAVTETQAVIKEVARQLRDRPAGWPGSLSRRGIRADRDRRADRLQHEYLSRLAAIARVGLQLGHVAMATAALASLREDFIMEQTGRIKNGHIQRLGAAAVVAVMLALASFLLIEWLHVEHTRANLLPLAAIGASVGAWLSFAARKVTLSFRELAVIEDDFVTPGARIAIVILLSMAVILMLGLKVVSIKLGDFDTSNLGADAALLIGFLCGLAERAIASGVVARAGTFAIGIGGKS